MKRYLKLIIFILIINISFITNVKALTPVEEHGKLNVKGTSIVDKNGKVFQLRGVSTHGISWFPQYINQETFTFIRENWNTNVIRLALYSDPSTGYNTSLHAKVKEGINYAINSGMYVIVDWHILNDGNPNTHKNEAISFFKEIATQYKDSPNIIYEICNEPNGNVKWESDIKPYAKDVINEIRKIDDDAIILVGTPTWSQDVDVVSNSPLEGYKNIMYTLHFYAATNKENIREKLNTALNNNLPIFISEFGLCDASGQGNIDYDEANKWMELIDKNDLSYVMWQLSNKNECSSLIRSDIGKLSNWSYDELSEQGKWLFNILKRYKENNKQEEDTKQKELKNNDNIDQPKQNIKETSASNKVNSKNDDNNINININIKLDKKVLYILLPIIGALTLSVIILIIVKTTKKKKKH